ncbi:MAG TPA: hypothetical protein DIS70_01630 [Anaerolineae bacterium]|nr:hypothetical protein [Anaerolineae bacterium]
MKQGSANAALPCFLLIKLFHPPLVSHSILKIIKPNKPKSDAGSGNGAGVDSAWEQKKLEARKMLACTVPHIVPMSFGIGRHR